MEQRIDPMEMLDLMVRPGFCVREDRVVKANHSALSRGVEPGTVFSGQLTTGQQEYAHFQSGCLYLTMELKGHSVGISVTRMGDLDVCMLEQDTDQPELRAMSLAARELREPLSGLMTTAEALLPAVAGGDPALREQTARMNRGLMQLLRIVGNMSDAGRCADAPARPETLDIRALTEEILSRCAQLLSAKGLTLEFENLPEPLFCLIDREKLERAVLNILSNAAKFTPGGGTVRASLTRRERMLCLQITDSGSGIREELRGSLHSRYLRQPGIEDGRFGLGLGMVLIRSAAACHGGTVLIDQPEGAGTRVTLTLAIRQNTVPQVRTPILRVDYAGERDHALLELSDALPASVYE